MRGISTRQFGHVTSPAGRLDARFLSGWGLTCSARAMPSSAIDDKPEAGHLFPGNGRESPADAPRRDDEKAAGYADGSSGDRRAASMTLDEPRACRL
jgi:hypothetical protein